MNDTKSVYTILFTLSIIIIAIVYKSTWGPLLFQSDSSPIRKKRAFIRR